MKKLFTILFTTTFYFSFACLNVFYGVTNEGNTIPLGENWLIPFDKNFNVKKEGKTIKELQQKLVNDSSSKHMLLSDYAVSLMKLGKAEIARDLLIELYKQHPTEYQLASNLGTAYELTSQVDSALKYIKRGIELNPNDHQGSEWIHVKILETKKTLEKDTLYFKNNTVLNLSETQKKDTLVFQQILIQLQERVPFSKGPKDQIMASLFEDLGDLSANTKSIEYAKAYYEIAKYYYGSTSSKLLRKITTVRRNYYQEQRNAQKIKTEYRNKNRGYKHTGLIPVRLFKYNKLLIDKNSSKQKVNWTTIETNVDTLLNFVGLKKELIEIKKQINQDTLSIVSQSQEKISISETENKEKPNYWLYGIIGLFLVLLIRFMIKKF